MYSGAKNKPEEVLQKVKDRFGIKIDVKKNNLEFIQLHKHQKMDGGNYPRFTLVMQTLAYNEVCAEALNQTPCDLFIDTVGVGFAYPIVKIIYGRRIMSYTHYPTISSDMLKQVDVKQFNNKVADSP